MQVNDDQLLVRFGGWDSLWTLRRQVRVPLGQIDQVTVREVGVLRPRWWWRLRGTDVPGVIRAGSFVARGGRELWDVRQAADVGATTVVRADCGRRFWVTNANWVMHAHRTVKQLGHSLSAVSPRDPLGIRTEPASAGVRAPRSET